MRRSTDGDFIHANVDIDLIIDEEPEQGSMDKPVEMFHIAEHFCLGKRRLHVFGRDSSIRPGMSKNNINIIIKYKNGPKPTKIFFNKFLLF